MNALLKLKNIIAGLLFVVATAALFYACTDESTVFIVLNKPGQQTFEKGDTIAFAADVQVIGADKIDATITWSSTNSSVATIDQKGMMIAVDTGITEIKATLRNGKFTMAEVRVSAQSAKELIISSTKLLLEVNGTYSVLSALVSPVSIMTVYPTEWTSDNPEVVALDSISRDSVSTKVRLHPLKVGKATITLKIGKKITTCVVTVSPKVNIAQSQLFLTVNGRESEVAALVTESLLRAGEEVKWASSDESILRLKVIKQVSGKSTAVVQPLNEGDAQLIVSAGSYSDTCIVHVGATVSLSWVIDKPQTLKSVTMFLNETVELPVFATITPDNDYFINKIDYVWTSSDAAAISTLSAHRDPANSKSSVCVLKAASTEGSALITITARGEQIKALVTVKDKEKILVESISLDKTQATLPVGKFVVLIPTVLEIGVVSVWPVMWKSSNEAIATVDADGKVTAISAGTAIITASSKDKSTTCSVTVTEEVISILINTDSRIVLMAGDTEIWTATVTPLSASSVFPTIWTSSNPSIATVSSTGKINAVSIGSVSITAQAGNQTNSRGLQVVPVETNVDFGSSIDNGSWNLSANKLTIKVEEGSNVYDFTINFEASQSTLQNGIYTIGSRINSGTFSWNNIPQISANLSSGTLQIANGTTRDKSFLFNFNIEIGTKTISIKGSGELDRE